MQQKKQQQKNRKNVKLDQTMQILQTGSYYTW